MDCPLCNEMVPGWMITILKMKKVRCPNCMRFWPKEETCANCGEPLNKNNTEHGMESPACKDCCRGW